MAGTGRGEWRRGKRSDANARGGAEEGEMNTRRSRRIRRATAEQLLQGAPVPVPDPLDRLLASAAAPPRPGELAREDMAVAAFHAARLAPVTASRRGQMVTPPLARFRPRRSPPSRWSSARRAASRSPPPWETAARTGLARRGPRQPPAKAGARPPRPEPGPGGGRPGTCPAGAPWAPPLPARAPTRQPRAGERALHRPAADVHAILTARPAGGAAWPGRQRAGA